MPSSTSVRESPDRGPWPLLLAVIFTGPTAWAVQLEANYVLSYVACEQRHTWMLHLCSAVMLAIVAVSAVIARRVTPPEDSPHSVLRFLSAAGFVSSLFFFLVIVATEIPVLLVPPCAP